MRLPRPGSRSAASAALGAVIPALALQSSITLAAPAAEETPPMETLVKPRLISPTSAIEPGRTFELGVTFDIHPGWHLYWQNGGDTGLPIGVELTLPDGFTAGPIHWPAPRRYVHTGLVDYIYEDQVTLIIPVDAPADAHVGSTARFGAALDWLVCKDVCLFGASEVSLSLPIVAGAPNSGPADSPDAPRFQAARDRLPLPLAAGRPPEPTVRWEDLSLVLVCDGASSMTFFHGPRAEDDPLDGGPVDILRDGHAAGARLRVEYKPGAQDARTITGVLECRHDGSTSFHLIDIPGPAKPPN